MSAERVAHVIIKGKGGNVDVQITGNLTPVEVIAGLNIAIHYVLDTSVRKGTSPVTSSIKEPKFEPRAIP